MTALPPPGWYADPEIPGMLRYWDGTQWSDHRAPPPPAATASSHSGLSSVGDWLAQSFNALRARWAPLAIVLAFTAIVAWLLVGIAANGFSDVRYSLGRWSGVDDSDWVALGLAVAGLVAMSFFSYLIVAHQMYHARLGVHQKLSASLMASLTCVPRAIGWALVFAAGLIIWLVVIGVVAAASGGLAVVLALASVPIAVWGGVKVAFMAPSLVVPVEGMNTVRASAEVSRDRWWGVFGRLIVLGLLGFLASIAVQTATALIQPSVDADDLDEFIVTNDDDEVLFLDLGGMIDELDPGGLAGIIASLPMTVLWMYQLAGLSVLYAETHQVRPGAPAVSPS